MDPKKNVNSVQNEVNEGTKRLIKAIEVGMYYGEDEIKKRKLRAFLATLGIKSARVPGDSLLMGGPLQIEDLGGILEQITFEEKYLGQWKKQNGK